MHEFPIHVGHFPYKSEKPIRKAVVQENIISLVVKEAFTITDKLCVFVFFFFMENPDKEWTEKGKKT